ncbi:hypothetical protein PV326_009443, partial [Microctonus aethiopoides]
SDNDTSNAIGPNLRSSIRKLESRKKVKRKATKSRDNATSPKAKSRKLSNLHRQQQQQTTQSQSIASLIPGTLILSGVSKIMPLVTPMASNIIVNGTSRSGNSIILGNTQTNPMIVMQPLVSRIQNTTVVSVHNELSTVNPSASATSTTTVQKVTLNTVPSIQANVGIDSQDWASNVKTIIDATKIGGRKGILPKGKEITKTTMAYKVPIPAVHRDTKLINKLIDINNDTKKLFDNKRKIKKIKSLKNKKFNEIKIFDKDSIKSQGTNTNNDIIVDSVKIIGENCGKKRKNIINILNNNNDNNNNKDKNNDNDVPPMKINKKKLPETCESIENLRHVVEKIGDNSINDIDIISNDKPKNLNEENYNIKNINTNSILNNDKFIVSDNKTNTSIINFDIKVHSNEIEKSDTSDKLKETTTDTINEMKKNILTAVTTSSKSCQVSDVIFTNQNSSTDTKSMESQLSTTTTTTISLSQEYSDVEKVISDDDIKKTKELCNIESGFHALLTTESTQPTADDHPTIIDNTKLILNLDTNTTTRMKPESNVISSSVASNETTEIINKNNEKDKERPTKHSLSYSIENSFIPIGNRTEALHSDLSNDLFASLQVPSSSHNPESISPTAAFLMAFPLVSSLNGKTEVLEEDMKEDLKYHSQTPPMLLQIGTIEPNSFKVKQTTDNDAIKCCTSEKNSKINSCQSTTIKTTAETSQKILPKVINTETFKERLYKVVPFTNSSKKSSELITLTSSSAACDDREKKIPPKSNVTSTAINDLSKYNTNIRYPSIPDYLPNYSTFTTTTADNQMLPQNNSTIVSSNSTSQCNSVSQSYPVYSSITKDTVQTTRQTNFIESSSSSSSLKQINSIDNQQTELIPERQEYHARTLNDGLSTTPASSSSQSLQYNYSSRPKDSYSMQLSRTTQSIYPEAENKNDSQCTMSTQSVTTNNNSTYLLHSKENINQMPYQGFSIAQTSKSIINNNTTSIQSTSASSFTQSRAPVDSLTSNLNNKDTTQTSYHNYMSISQTKDLSSSSSTITTTEIQQQRANNDQLQNLGQSYPTQVKQISSIDTFDNNIQQQRNYLTTRKQDSYGVQTNTIDQRIKSLPDNVTKSENNSNNNINNNNNNNNNNNQNVDTLFQTKRNDTQSYIPYQRETKKIFDANINNNTNAQITKSIVQNSSLSRYQLHQQQQQIGVTISNYCESTVSENISKTTTTLANNSSNFSILSWTTFSPICGGNNGNNTHNTSNTSGNNSNNNNSTGGNNNNSNNNIVQFESTTEHVNDTQENKICNNFNYTTLHKDNIGYSNIMSTADTAFSTDTSTITDDNIDKTKKLNQKNQTQYDNSTINKTKNSVQSTIVPQQQQKSSRSHVQNQNINDNFKFNENDSNKNKNKFPIDSSYTQTEFATLNQSQRHQNTSKSQQQIVSSKTEKSPGYSMPGFDSQVTFDIPDAVPPTKCNADNIYSGSNYKYPNNKEQLSQIKYQPIVQTQPAIIQQDNSPYNGPKQNQSQQQQQTINNSNNNTSNDNKTKPIVQQQTVRPPVNWMMTPEIKHNTNITDIILPPIGKELEFCPNNIFSQTPSYNQSTTNQFYNNYDATVSSAHTFSNVSTLQTDSRRIIDSFYTDDQQYSWSPTKNPQTTETMKSIEQQAVVPSTLPTLVGDLALGTNIPEKQNFLYNQMPPRSTNDLIKPSIIKEKETNTVNRDYQVMLNPQTIQHTTQSGSFLSVSQLVDHEKEKTHHQHQNHHHHSQHQQQHQQTQGRKPPRKGANTNPRGGGAKRQIEMRKQQTEQQMQQQQQQQQNQPQVQQQHNEEQKVSTSHGFTDQTYQQSQQQSIKYQQNDPSWRSRNCKSNYTAESLIGVNNTSNINETNNTDKQLHTPSIKFSSDYSQNKFPTSLSTTDMVMPIINYLSNPDDGNGYGQMMNQNFNHSSYSYSTNSNIYPSTNFMSGISNTPTSYPMMPLHDNPTDYLETNSFLLSNVSGVTSTIKTPSTITSSVSTRPTTLAVTPSINSKNQQQYGNNNVGKHQNFSDKRNNSYPTASKKSKRKPDATMNNLDFSISGVSTPMEDYHSHPSSHHHHHHPPPPPPPHHHHPHHHHHHHHHHGHSTSFLATPHANTLYQNHSHTSASVGLATNSNRVRGSLASSNSVAMAHHPSGTSLTNFNLSTIFPEINDKF